MKTHECPLCRLTFRSKRLLNTHLSLICSSVRRSIERVSKNTSSQNDDDFDPLKNMCVCCGVVCDGGFDLGVHWSTCHTEISKNRCHFCGKNLSLLSDDESSSHHALHRSMNKMNLRIATVFCGVCDSQLCTKRDLKTHFHEVHNSEISGQCNSSTDGKNVISTVKTKRKLNCPHCPSGFSTSSTLYMRAHNLNFHKELYKNYCRFCGALYNMVLQVRSHEKTCEFRRILVGDTTGENYIRLWRCVAFNDELKKKMITECHSYFIDTFLLTSETDISKLLPLVPLKLRSK